ncbi:MAG: MOSC N-terminal beta barrel domain-containing protein [Pseudomonadota bacterium]
MTPHLAAIFRHPIKSVGRERLEAVALSQGAPMPADRAWAVLHAAGEDGFGWRPCRNFLRVAGGPRLAQVDAETRGDELRLTHPDRDPLTFDPDTEAAAFLAWVAPLWPEARPAPKRLEKAPPEGMADNGAAEVSLLNLSSLRALSEKAGRPLEVERFRGNLILDGLPPWAEFDWIDREIRVGAVTLRVSARIDRCRATEANPATGRRDATPLAALQAGWGHRDFGVTATVTRGGRVVTGDAVVE